MKIYSLMIGIAVLWSCQAQKETTEEQPLPEAIESSLDLAVEQYKRMDETVPDTLLPRTTNPDGTLRTNETGWWTSGFFPGSLWYLYEHSQDEEMLALARKRSQSIIREQWNAYDHDIGFKMFCSFGNGLRLTGDTSYIPVLLTSAQTLTTRFDPRVGCIRSWGSMSDEKDYMVIVDNMMNLELLFWATRQSGDSTFYKMALSHADTTLKQHYRPDGSSYHVVHYDPQTGEATRKRTAQGYADESAWARGQAWGLYGYVMCYRETGLERYLHHAIKIADFLLNHPNLPEDKIPYWDFNAPDIPDALRDASAGAIMASALIELSGYAGSEKRDFYLDNAEVIVANLSSEQYRAALGENNNFLLMHSVGHIPENSEVDVPLSYADYYYIEAMMRLKAME